MNELLDLLQKRSFVLLFLFLQGISLTLLVKSNDHRSRIFQYNMTHIQNGIKARKDKIQNYWNLAEANTTLHAENTELIQKLKQYEYSYAIPREESRIDSVHSYISSYVIENSVNSARNFILARGGKDRKIAPGDGVITQHGVVGQVYSVSDHYSKIMSCLHMEMRLSAGLLGSNYAGYLQWYGRDPEILMLEGVPKQVQVELGDTVITQNGVSFPRHHPVGLIVDIQIPEGSDFYKCKVQLFQDPRDLDHIIIFHHGDRSEVDALRQANYR